MSHALIIEYHMLISRAIEDRLAALGFTTFSHVSTEHQAVAVASRQTPDLIVVGETGGRCCHDALARFLLTEHGSPIVVIEGACCAVYKMSHEGVSVSPPIQLSDIEAAVALAEPALRLPIAA